jgi:hypothetical protein
MKGSKDHQKHHATPGHISALVWGTSVIMQLVMKKLIIKLHARQPPQKKGVPLTAITPASDRVGIKTIPTSRTNPIDFARTGCFPKMHWQMGEFLFRVEKPISAPKNAPINKVMDMVKLLGVYEISTSI